MEKFWQNKNSPDNLDNTKKFTRRDFLQFMLKASLVGGVALLTKDFNVFIEKDKKSEKPISKEGIKSIFACIIDSENIDENTKKMIVEMGRYDNGTFVDNLEDGAYMISPCDNKDKYSEVYFDCSGVVVAGESRESENTQISILTHQDPKQFLEKDKERFVNDFRKSLSVIKKGSKETSINALVFGGSEGDENYIKSIKLLGEIIKDELGFEPLVATGPNIKTGKGSTGVYFDTQNRRLYIVRPAHDSKFNESYLPSEIEDKRKNW